jgi:dTMP kinase
MPLSMRGKFITLEGIDGAGKSTHLAWLADFCRGRGSSVVITREPGGTALGEHLRDLLLHGASIHPDTEALLMFAVRSEHLKQVIAPALAQGAYVICDRFTDATFAYQGGGRGVDWIRLSKLEDWVQQGLQPDLTLLFDLTPAIARARAGKARVADRFEQEQEEFYSRVRYAYLRRAQEAPQRVQIVDAERSVEEVQQQMAEIMETLWR